MSGRAVTRGLHASDPPSHGGRHHVQPYLVARPGRAPCRSLQHRPPIPYRRVRGCQHERGFLRGQVLGRRRNGRLEPAGDRPDDSGAGARDQRDSPVHVSLARSTPRCRGGTGSPGATSPDRRGYRWRFGRCAELVLPGQRRPARSRARRARCVRPVAGRAAGARVLSFAQGDLVGLTSPLLPPIGPPPVGPGYWIYAPPPVIALGNLGARPFFLTSQDQLRSAPPPAFGSDAFNAALAEVRQISDTRTQEQINIANYWNVNQSPRSQAAFMGIARELIVSHRRTDAEAARILFVMSSAGFDALIGCFDAKYHYWLIRPPQADAGIHTVFPTPQHPSYPSAHSCFSGAFSAVLADAFPSERARMDAMAQEASLSRLYAGIHYRFDMEAGLALGRGVAALALAADLDQVAPGTRSRAPRHRHHSHDRDR